MNFCLSAQQQQKLANKYPGLSLEAAFNRALSDALRDPDFVARALRAADRKRLIKRAIIFAASTTFFLLLQRAFA